MNNITDRFKELTITDPNSIPPTSSPSDSFHFKGKFSLPPELFALATRFIAPLEDRVLAACSLMQAYELEKNDTFRKSAFPFNVNEEALSIINKIKMNINQERDEKILKCIAPYVTELDLSSNVLNKRPKKLAKIFPEKLAKIFPDFKSLKKLNLSNIQYLSYEAIDALPESIENLSLAYCKLWVGKTNGLFRLTNIETLDLSGNEVNHEVIRDLFRYKLSKTIKKLLIAEADLRYHTLFELTNCKNLKELVLSKNPYFHGEGLIPVPETLEKLNLSSCDFSNKDLTYINKFNNIKFLDLSCNPAISDITCLKVTGIVDLSGCNLTEESKKFADQKGWKY